MALIDDFANYVVSATYETQLEGVLNSRMCLRMCSTRGPGMYPRCLTRCRHGTQCVFEHGHRQPCGTNCMQCRAEAPRPPPARPKPPPGYPHLPHQEALRAPEVGNGGSGGVGSVEVGQQCQQGEGSTGAGEYGLGARGASVLPNQCCRGCFRKMPSTLGKAVRHWFELDHGAKA